MHLPNTIVQPAASLSAADFTPPHKKNARDRVAILLLEKMIKEPV